MMNEITPLKKQLPQRTNSQQLVTKPPSPNKKSIRKAYRPEKKAERKTTLSNFISKGKNVITNLKDNIQSARNAGSQAPMLDYTTSSSSLHLKNNMSTYILYGAAALVSGIIIYKTLKK